MEATNEVSKKKRKFVKAAQARHFISGCHGIERRRALAAARGDHLQVEHFLTDNLLEYPSALMLDYDVLSLVLHGHIIC